MQKKTSPTQVYLHIANKDNLLLKHCITMLQVRFTIIFVSVSLIVTGLPGKIRSEITEIVDEKYVLKISKIQNFRNTKNQ